MTFYGGRPTIFVKEPVFVGKAGDPIPAAPKRWLDKHSPNVRSMLNSLVPNIAKKCAHCRSPHVPVTYALNVCNVAKVLLSKHYPISWWRPKLLKKAASWGLETEVLSGIQLAGNPSVLVACDTLYPTETPHLKKGCYVCTTKEHRECLPHISDFSGCTPLSAERLFLVSLVLLLCFPFALHGCLRPAPDEA